MAFSSKDHGADAQEECSPTLRAGGHDGSHANAGVPPAICFKPSHFTRDKDGAPSDVAPPLSADADKGDQDTVICAPAEEVWRSTCSCGHQYTGPLSMACPKCGGYCGATHGDPIVMAIQDVRGIDKQQNGIGINDDGSAYTVDSHATQGVAVEAIAFQPRHYTRDNKPGGKADVVAGALTSNTKEGDTSPHVATFQQSSLTGKGTLGYDDSGVAKPCKTQIDGQMLQTEMMVRRLTPTECERLQGFPDGFTKIPSRAMKVFAPDGFEGDPNNPKHWAADGPRYKVLGNSMATNVMRWIGKRLMQLEALTSKSSASS